MSFENFVRESGLKVLAMARLTPCEYSITLYLLNCSVSGLDQVITTEAELASLIGYDEKTLREAIESLSQRGIIRAYYKAGHGHERQSLRIGMAFELNKWILDFEQDATTKDAIVFPFRRRGSANLTLIDNGAADNFKAEHTPEQLTWQRVFESFVRNRSLDDDELTLASASSKVLVETHPVDQVLLMIRHFGQRIPTLSLLASSWQHYQELFEEETQKVDILDARQKHHELDEKLRKESENLLGSSEEGALTDEERAVLQILIKHRHPRRQLFWAYQTRNRYPNLAGFFADHAHLMLAITTSGTVVRKKD